MQISVTNPIAFVKMYWSAKILEMSNETTVKIEKEHKTQTYFSNNTMLKENN